MSFRGRGRGGGGGRGRGRGGGRGGRGGGSFGQRDFNQGPPDSVVEVGEYLHPCEGDLVCKSSSEKVPYFNAPIYLENKSQVGKIDEIFGQVSSHLFSVKLLPNMQASSFKAAQKLFIDPMKLLPLSRFMQKPGSVQKRGGGRGRGGQGGPRGRGGGRGRGRGGFTPRGGRGGSRGGGRGFGGGGRGGGRGRGFRGR